MVRRLRVALFCLVLFRSEAVLGESVAPSPPSDPISGETEEATEAKHAFLEGLELLRNEDWAAAEVKFRRSVALLPRQSTLYDLAFVLFKEGRSRESLGILERLLADRDGTRDPRYREYAEALVPHVLSQIAMLRVVVRPSSASVSIDGEPAPGMGERRTFPVDPGRHHVEAAAPGFLVARVELVANAGTEIEQRITLAPAPTEVVRSPGRPAAAVAPVEHRSPLNSAGPWLTIGMGSALLAASVVTGILANNADNDFTSQCPTLRGCDPQLKATRDDAIRLGRITDVLLVSGGVVVATGVTWRLLLPATPGSSSGRTLLIAGAGVF